MSMAVLGLSAWFFGAMCQSAISSGSAICSQQPGQECKVHSTESMQALVPEDEISMLQMMQKSISGLSRLTGNRSTQAPGNYVENLQSLQTPFHLYSAQCSHNTYAIGNQVWSIAGMANIATSASHSPSVTAHSMTLALSLGYRCIELDVWPRKNQKKDLAVVTGGIWKGPPNTPNAPHSRMKVTHHGVSQDVLNNVDLTLFIQKLLEWFEADEQAHPASQTAPKLPITISIENHAANTEDEDYLLEKFRWLDFHSATGDGAPRLVMPADFVKGVKMEKLAAIGGDVRRVILKSKIKEGSTSKYHEIIAMKGKGTDVNGQPIKKPPIKKPWFKGKQLQPDATVQSSSSAYVSKSIEIGKLTAALVPSTEQQIEAGQLVKDSVLVRTFPYKTNTNSENYNPSALFSKSAQMICVNLQGSCPNSNSICSAVDPGAATGAGCSCDRSIAAVLEQVFNELGYDGYINYEHKTPAQVAQAMTAKLNPPPAPPAPPAPPVPPAPPAATE